MVLSCPYKLCPVCRMTSGAIQYGVPFIDLAPETVACSDKGLIRWIHISEVIFRNTSYSIENKVGVVYSGADMCIPTPRPVLMHQNLQV